MKITKPTKPILKLDEADKEFCKNFLELCELFSKSDFVDFRDFLEETYEISDADIEILDSIY